MTLARLLNHEQALRLAHMGKDIHMEIDGKMQKVTPDTHISWFYSDKVKFYWKGEEK